MRQFISLMLITFLISSTLFAQSNKSGKSENSRYNPRFSFEPPTRDSVAISNITVALLKPVFIDKDIASAGAPWNNFSSSMQNDIEGLLIAKGLKVRGPFNTQDEMVFNDKKNSDFTFLISLDLRLDDQRTGKDVFQLLATSNQVVKVTKGSVSISPEITLTAISNFSGEKLWKKRLPLTQMNFIYVGTVKWDGGFPTILRELELENNFYNPLAKDLEEIYKEGLKTMWNQFDVNEMKMIANEAQKERSTDSKDKQ